mgnify:CR=1 FL=1
MCRENACVTLRRTYPDLRQFKVLKLLTFQYFVLIETCLTSAEEIFMMGAYLGFYALE